MGSGDLTLGVAYDGSWLNPAGAPELRQGDGYGKEKWLHDLDAIDRRRALGAEHDVAQRPLDVRRQRFLAFVDPAPEDVRVAGQLGRHPKPLAALSGKEEDGILLRAGCTGDQTGRSLPPRERLEGIDRLVVLGAHEHRAVLEGRATRGEGIGEVEGLQPWVALEVGDQA